MQMKSVLPACLLAAAFSMTHSETNNPLSGVITMLDTLSAKITKDGEDEAKAYKEYYDWCNVVTGEELHAITLSKERKDKLVADIEKYFAEIEQSGAAISEEAKAIAQAIKDGTNAKDLREKQHADFMAAEKELVDATDMLSRAITVLEKEMKKGSAAAAFTQMISSRMPQVLQVLQTVMDAASFSSADKSKMLALVESQQASDDEAAPSAAVYSTKTGSIVDVLSDMKDKAETQLEELRKGEQQARYVFNQLVAALKAQKQADEKDLNNEKSDKSEATEDKADAEKDLSGNAKVLDVHSEAYRKTKAQCVQTASDHEQTVKARAEELKVLADATKILQDMTGGATSRTYSFIQESTFENLKLQTEGDLVALEVITLVKRMAKSHHSAALAQLASSISATASRGASEDVFAKIKGMIKAMIDNLEKDQQSEASEKAYCDEQTKTATAKEAELMDQIKTLSNKVDQKTSKSVDAKAEVSELQEELAKIDKAQKDLDKIRSDEHAAFLEAKTDLETGIKGVRKAVALLQDYYSKADDVESTEDGPAPEAAFLQSMRQPSTPEKHSKSGGSIDGIVQILSMTESDFATGLAKEQTEESDSQNEYEQATAENEVEKAALSQQVKYKVKEFKALDQKIVQHKSDHDATKTEHSAATDFLEQIKKKCAPKKSSYQKRQEKRQAEITGLKEAKEILENEVAFTQRRKFSGRLRGVHLSM